MADGGSLALLVDSLAGKNEYGEALSVATRAIGLIMNDGREDGSFEVKCMGSSGKNWLADPSHIVLRKAGGNFRLEFQVDMMSTTFSYYVGRFATLRDLCKTAAVREQPEGSAIVDLGDGSNNGSYPRMSFCSGLAEAVLVVDSYFVERRGYEEFRERIKAAWVPWEVRRPVIFWRGSTSGQRRYTPSSDAPIIHWNWLQRLQLCHVAQNSRLRGIFDVGITQIAQMPETHLRNAVARSGLLREHRDRADFVKYRYLIDIDGNSNSWSGLFEAMLMGACVLKVASPAGFREWYYDRLIPWGNFIPVKDDLSDLEERAEWAISHEAECRSMAANLRQLAESLEFEREFEESGKRIAELLKANVPASNGFTAAMGEISETKLT